MNLIQERTRRSAGGNDLDSPRRDRARKFHKPAFVVNADQRALDGHRAPPVASNYEKDQLVYSHERKSQEDHCGLRLRCQNFKARITISIRMRFSRDAGLADLGIVRERL